MSPAKVNTLFSATGNTLLSVVLCVCILEPAKCQIHHYLCSADVNVSARFSSNSDFRSIRFRITGQSCRNVSSLVQSWTCSRRLCCEIRFYSIGRYTSLITVVTQKYFNIIIFSNQLLVVVVRVNGCIDIATKPQQSAVPTKCLSL